MLEKILKSKGAQDVIMQQLPKALEPFSEFLNQINLTDGEDYATLSILNRNGCLMVMMMTVDASLFPKRYLYTNELEKLLLNPQLLEEIREDFFKKGYLKD